MSTETLKTQDQIDDQRCKDYAIQWLKNYALAHRITFQQAINCATTHDGGRMLNRGINLLRKG